MEDIFFPPQTWGGGWFGDDSSTLHLLYNFISIIITMTSPQIIRFSEVGYPLI